MADEIDHCAEAERLRQRLTQIAEGMSVSSARFGDDQTNFAKADVAELKRILAYHERECARQRGCAPKRTRFAAPGVARPY